MWNMTRAGRFVTAGRALTACLLAVGCALLTRRLESGAVLTMPGLPAVVVLPACVVGMVMARRFRIAHWSYFVGLGVAIAGVPGAEMIWRAPSAGAVRAADVPMFWSALLAPGLTGGLVCWLYLRLTWSRRLWSPR